MKRYLLVAFGASWLVGLGVAFASHLFPKPGVAGQIASTVLSVAFMFGPLVGTVVAQRQAGELVLKPLGAARTKLNRWWLVAWLGPVGLAALAALCALPLPGVELSLDLSGFVERLSRMLPDSDVQGSLDELRAVPAPVFWGLLIVQPLVAGATINAVAAFGEEIGWRGYMHRALIGRGFWTTSLIVGAVWGVWHAPLIVQGHNYPEHPFLGVFMMVLWCVLLAPPFHYVRLKTGSVIAVSVMHGTLNACAGVALMFLKGGNDLLVGVTGLSGMLALVLVNLGILVGDRAPHGPTTAERAG